MGRPAERRRGWPDDAPAWPVRRALGNRVAPVPREGLPSDVHAGHRRRDGPAESQPLPLRQIQARPAGPRLPVHHREPRPPPGGDRLKRRQRPGKARKGHRYAPAGDHRPRGHVRALPAGSGVLAGAPAPGGAGRQPGLPGPLRSHRAPGGRNRRVQGAGPGRRGLAHPWSLQLASPVVHARRPHVAAGDNRPISRTIVNGAAQ